MNIFPEALIQSVEQKIISALDKFIIVCYYFQSLLLENYSLLWILGSSTNTQKRKKRTYGITG